MSSFHPGGTTILGDISNFMALDRVHAKPERLVLCHDGQQVTAGHRPVKDDNLVGTLVVCWPTESISRGDLRSSDDHKEAAAAAPASSSHLNKSSVRLQWLALPCSRLLDVR